jgi:hypothetical protein
MASVARSTFEAFDRTGTAWSAAQLTAVLPPGSCRSAASRRGTSQAVRSTQPTTPAISGSAAASASSIPTLMAFRDGILVFSQPGALPSAGLERLIQAVRELDMDEVRADLAQPQAERAPR